MRYLVMISATQADYDAMTGKASAGSPAWGEEDMRAMFAFMEDLNAELVRTNEMVDAQGLLEPAQTRLVRAGEDGEPVIEDSPYGPDDELPAGYWVLDCASLERVTEIAARVTRCPQPAGAPARPVVIRPLGAGDEVSEPTD
ncbi:YciI family protein [Streptomyces nitrosporeus]|uniref:YciI family protein n=1 Tax=Streptomyces nitrosporeus TaxID=28894 RepID=UPI0039A0F22A